MRKILTAIFAGMLGIGIAVSQHNAHNKLRMAESAIVQFYVDTVNEDKLVEDAIKGMLEKLDPHSSYTTAEETRELNEPLQGNFSGIGITFNMNQDTLYVIQTVASGPSERVGVLAGDRIIAVNDSSIAGMKMKNSDIMKRLRGPKGTDVEIKVLRRTATSSDTIDFRITRDDIPINSVEAYYMVDDTTGYLRLSRFALETPKEVTAALRKLKKDGMTGLILDITDNGGGYLDAAVSMLGEFFEPGRLMVFTEGRSSSRYDHHSSPSSREPLFADGRLVVMVNQYSASASEITSGAVQDWDRGVVVGRRTFGKGLVQRPFPFPDGSMMRLTMAHYYTPTGRDIQKPYEAGESGVYNRDIADRFDHGELMHEDSVKHNEALARKTLINGRKIYGGGGIYPDKFVPLDTTEYTRYYRDVMAKGLLNRFAISYVDKHRKEIRKEYGTDSEFVKRFEVTPEMLSEIRRLAEDEKITYDEEQAEKSRRLLSTVVKELIGRDVFENATFYKVYNEYNPIFREAYSIITSDDYDKILNGVKP